MAKPYEERFAAAMKSGSRAATVASLITETEGMIQAAELQRDTLRTRALDLGLGADKALALRRDAEDQEFGAERLRRAAAELRSRFTALTESESAKAAQAEKAAVAAEAAQLADEIREVIPATWAKLIDLFSRMRASDSRVEAANRIGGGDHIVTAEEQARGYRGWTWPNLGGPVDRLTQMVLPKFDTYDNAWPPPEGREALAAYADHAAQIRLNSRMEAERAEQEKTRWKPVVTTYNGGSMITDIANRDGTSGAASRPLVVEMDDAQIAAARRRGVGVVPFDAEKHADVDIHTALRARMIREIQGDRHRSTTVLQVTG